ncbi:MAG: purine-nucleoside phosphorylase [Bdellovibrio sp.]|nr:MAG: purine-nucleoside phosphorylase [Bdellovibrio sp.]
MLEKKSLSYFQGQLSAFGVSGASSPKAHLVLGSGFGRAIDNLADWQVLGSISFAEVPGLSAATVVDHAGEFRLLRHRRQPELTVVAQVGRLHGFEGHSARAVVAPVMLSRLSGVRHFILTNAVGGLDLRMKVGDVMMISDHINWTGSNPLIGKNPVAPNGKEIGPRFPDMGDLYSREWRHKLRPALEAQGLKVHEGCYLGLLGPSYETHAEIQMFAQLRAGAVGMSTVWEAIALKHSGARILGLSMITNMGAGITAETINHEELLKQCRNSASQAVQGIFKFIEANLT